MVAQAASIAPARISTVLDEAVSADTIKAVDAMVRRRTTGEPLQYILGTWSFRHLEVTVDPRALVPRPETEQVVEVALSELQRLARARGETSDPLVAVDLGTGSGVIALSLALEAVDAVRGSSSSGTPAEIDIEVWATDASSSALELARINLAALAGRDAVAASRLTLAEGSWFDALPPGLAGRVHLVVSNPPYVSAAEWAALDSEVRDHEPAGALVPGETGLEAIEILVDQGRSWLAPGGVLVVELAPHQAATVLSLAEKAGYVDVAVLPDLAGRARTLRARWTGA
jgi:release factor glutamine methyltransferase